MAEERNNLGRNERRRLQSRRIYERRRQRVRRQLMLLGVVAILVILSIGSCTRNLILKRKAQETSVAAGGKSGGKKEQEKGTRKQDGDGGESADEKLARVKKEAEEAGCPKEIIKLLSKNPETVDFVADYPAKKGTAPADTIGKVKKGEIPLLIQWDERWGYSDYGTSTIAVSGCGPTCMAMVAAGLTGDESVTPAKVAAYSEQGGYVNESNDTAWLFMEEAAGHWGLVPTQVMAEESAIEEELSAGHPIICSVGPGDFTRNGHFLVLTGYEDGKLKIHDPFSKENSEKMWSYKKIKKQIQAIWSYTKAGET